MKLFYISFLYLTYFYLVDSESHTSKNLIFVYDVINPGIEYINFVQGVEKIYNKLFQTKRIFNKISVVFPFNQSVETITFDEYTNVNETVEQYLLQGKSLVEAERTEKEQSRVLTGLWVGLYNIEPNSLIYVITKAKPEERPMMQYIQCQIDNKMIEVGFIIQRNSQKYDIPNEYQEISFRSNGLVLTVDSDTEIMTFMTDLLTTTIHKVNLLTVDNHSKKSYNILVDEYLEEITTASWVYDKTGEYIRNYFNHSEFSRMTTHTLQKTRILCALKTKVVSYKGVLSGSIFVNVDTNSNFFGLRVFGISALNFNYGFSVEKCSCGSKWLNKPMMDTSNYIYISSTSEEYGAVFTSCAIIAADNSFLREIPLQKNASNSDRDVYYGTFVPGSEAFYLRVTASINGKIVHRMSSFAISPFKRQEAQNDTNGLQFSSKYTNTTYYGNNNRPKRQIIKFV